MSLSMKALEKVCPLVMESAGAGNIPSGAANSKIGVSVTPYGRVTEQLRVTVPPAMMEEEGEEVREMVAGSEDTLQ